MLKREVSDYIAGNLSSAVENGACYVTMLHELIQSLGTSLCLHGAFTLQRFERIPCFTLYRPLSLTL